MYVQITTRCNMKCRHCMFSCTRNGEDMDIRLFRDACLIAAEIEHPIILGGGEPTLHPQVIEMVGLAVMSSWHETAPSLITNGTADQDTWNHLFKAYRQKHLHLNVSRDPWHDAGKIQDWVYRDAGNADLWWGNGKYRMLVAQGRAKTRLRKLEQEAYEWGYHEVNTRECDYCGPVLKPDGHIYAEVRAGWIDCGPLSLASYEKANDMQDNDQGESMREANEAYERRQAERA